MTILVRPLLAAKTTEADLQRLQYPVLGSPKIDGIRALISNGWVLSRTMKQIPNRYTQAVFGLKELEGLDGELVVGRPWDKNLMQQTTSGVMTHGGIPRNLAYYVFDRWDAPDKHYAERLQELVWTHGAVQPDLVVLHHELIESYEDLLAYEQKCLRDGYEGIMIRSVIGKYKQGRSTVREGILLKVKRFHDAEATITGFEPLLRNENAATLDERGYTKRSSSKDGKFADDLLGSLTVKDLATGVQFDIGSGFTEAQRIGLWNERHTLIGKLIKYKSFANAGVKDKPRFPIFLGFRSPLDL